MKKRITRYNIHNMDYLGYPNLKAQKNVLHKHLKVYKQYSEKMYKKQKELQLGP